ncbi:hypothetical protein AAHE18_20G258300 [Arachis hypogaea]
MDALLVHRITAMDVLLLLQWISLTKKTASEKNQNKDLCTPEFQTQFWVVRTK